MFGRQVTARLEDGGVAAESTVEAASWFRKGRKNLVAQSLYK
jgi:hypothetical protein